MTEQTPSERLYIAAQNLVQAIQNYADMRVRREGERRNYYEAWDICPIRGARSEIARWSEEVYWTMRDMALDCAPLVINGAVYLINRAGKISPSPVPMYAIVRYD